MKSPKIFHILPTILFLLILITCKDREITNPFDTACPKEVFTPTDLKAEQQGAAVKLTWKQANTNISRFVISRNENDGAMAEVAKVDKSVTLWTDNYINGAKKYGYQLLAYAGENQSNVLTVYCTPINETAVTTDAASGITSTSAVLGGNVINDNGITITERGICYSTTLNPTTSSTKAEMGSGKGAFSLNITGLTAGTTYYARAYTTNKLGTTYGIQVTFITSFLTVTPASINIPKDGGSKVFTVASNIDWQVTSDQTWCTLSSNTGKGNSLITATYTENKEVPQRTVTITFTGTGVISQSVTLTQAGTEPPALSITPANQNVTNVAGTSTFTIASNVNWTVQSDQSWCKFTNSSGTGNATLNVNYEANTTYNQRIATITILGNGITPKTTTLTQTGTEPPVLSVTPANQTVTNLTGTTTFNITSNVSWTATSDQTWCTITSSGALNSSLTANFNENNSGAQRIATITIKANGLTDRTITLTQRAFLVNVALANSGAIATAISVGSYDGITHNPVSAIDGDTNSYWASNWSMPSWVQVQFNKVYSISKVGVWWGGCQHTFSISLSLDGTNWTVVVPSKLSSYIGGPPVHDVFDITPMNAKFIKCNITTTNAPSGWIFQSILHDLEAYGN